MAIAEMSRMTLVALLSDKEKVYDALQKTGAAQIKTQEEREQTVPLAVPCGFIPEFYRENRTGEQVPRISRRRNGIARQDQERRGYSERRIRGYARRVFRRGQKRR